jgi:undecaprenyl-diphosphatase
MHNYVSHFDRLVAGWIRMLPAWLQPLLEFVTIIGQPIVVLAVGAAIAITSLVRGAERIALVVGLGYVAFGINTLIKNAVHRVRPDTLYAHDMRIKSYSFPSGHSFGSMFFYGLLAYLAFTHLPHPWNGIVAGTLLCLIFLIGISRVYLGAHFPSDVVAGWLYGFICLVVAIKIAKI